MSIKPLCLGYGIGARVRSEKNALVVRAAGRAASIYPFKRLSRVVSANDVHWQCGALLACLQAGVPVSFIDHTGKPLGYCNGVRRRETTLEGLLRYAIENPQWEKRYKTWLSGMQNQAMREAVRRAGLRCWVLRAQTVRAGFCNAWLKKTGRPAGHLFRHIDGGLSTCVHRVLSTVFAAPEMLCFPLPGLSFIHDLTRILRWPVYSKILLRAGRQDVRQPPDRMAAIWLQRMEPFVLDCHNEILRRMELWLRGWVL